MNRRDMLRATLAGALGTGGILWAPEALLAANERPAENRAGDTRTPGTNTPGADPLSGPFAGSLYYTKDRPGRWSGKEDGHLPVIQRDGAVIQVRTLHPQDGFKHYIVKHMVLDKNFRILVDTAFNPWRDDPVSTANIAGLDQVVYAVSVCNIHDAWLAPLKL